MYCVSTIFGQRFVAKTRLKITSVLTRVHKALSMRPEEDEPGTHHAEGQVDPKVRELQNGFRFWIPQRM
jgi:hypothetical protein